jgi:hypothetical protein
VTEDKPDIQKYCSGPIIGWTREPAEDGGEWLEFNFEAGGKLVVHTYAKLIWIACRNPKSVN